MSDETTESVEVAPPKRRGRPPKAKPAVVAARADVPVVAERNDPKQLEPYAKSRATTANARPGFHREWFLPAQLPKKLTDHEIGNEYTGYLMVQGWSVVPVEKVQLERGMASAGRPVDTVASNGELVLCETPLENYAKYDVIKQREDKLIDQRLTGGEKVNFGGKTSLKVRTVGGRDGLDVSTNDVLHGVH
jgi:hypothetical protein